MTQLIIISLSLIVCLVILFLFWVYWKNDLKKNELKLNNDNYLKTDILDKKKSVVNPSIFIDSIKEIDIKNQVFLEIKNEISKKIIWMSEFINSTLINILVWWHILVEWVPWLAKTKTIETLSNIFDLSFTRVQFTPDMLPSDLIWAEIYNYKTWNFEIKKWVIFTNFFLADEINRTSPKVQSALLEAMQEKKISIWWVDFDLPKVFVVFATQNPVEQEWTFELPEAQIDRFLFKVLVNHPTIEEEIEILNIIENEKKIIINKVINIEKIIQIQNEISKVNVWKIIKEYITRIIFTSRNNKALFYGISPRWSIWLMIWAKALAYLEWRDFVIFEDIQRIAMITLRHRIKLKYDAKLFYENTDNFLIDLLKNISLT